MTELMRYYDPRPLGSDPAETVPTIPNDVPVYALCPADAPTQSRPDDFDAKGRPRLRYLSRREYAVIVALTEALIQPPEDRYIVTPQQAGVNVDRYLAAMRTPMRLQIKFALHLLNAWTLKSLKLPFRMMSKSARREWVKRFALNRGFVVTKISRLKNLVYLNYYGDPRMNAYTGYRMPTERSPEMAALRRHLRHAIWQPAPVSSPLDAPAPPPSAAP